MSSYKERVLLDRYAIKDATRELQVDDMVVTSISKTFEREARTIESREVGHVCCCLDDGTFDVRIANDQKEVITAIQRDRLDYCVEQCYDDICQRVARAVAPNDPEFRNIIIELMRSEKFIPAGRPLAGLGRQDHDLTLFNCYVFGIESDSRAGIANHWARLFETYSRGGGIGWNLSILRPKGAVVRKVNGRSSGSVSWAEQFSQITGAVEQGGSRRGAGLQGLEVWHPDILDFIDCKALREEFKAPDGQVVSRNRNLLCNSNVSVLITRGFMKAVERDTTWDLVFPALDDPDYDREWDGNIERWQGLGKKVVKYQTIQARDLWNRIVQRAWESGEPGIIFLDRCNEMSNSWYYNRLTSTNPCVTGDTLVLAWQKEKHHEPIEIPIRELVGHTNLRLWVDDRELGPKAMVPQLRNQRLALDTANTVVHTGKRPIWKLQVKAPINTSAQHDNYVELKATGDHKVRTPRGMVPMQDLQQGDQVHVVEGGVAEVLSCMSQDEQQDVYDIVNTVTHTFIANGIVVSNCGEQALGKNSVCNLGHLNLAKFVKPDHQFPDEERTAVKAARQIDWNDLTQAIQTGVRFLDRVIDLNHYHEAVVEKQQTGERRIGLGILGYHEMLLRLGLRYGSPAALKFTTKLIRYFCSQSYLASSALAAELGSFPLYDAKKFAQSGFMKRHTKQVKQAIATQGIRNVTVNSIAPTGSVSSLLQTSGGCEPFFALEYTSTTRIGVVRESMPVGEDLAQRFGPDRAKWPDYVVTAQRGIEPTAHVQTQGVLQRWIDSCVSKCIAAGTLVPTDKGLISVELFASAHKIDTFVPTNGEFRTGGHRILSHYRAGQKTATRIRLDNGAELVGATESHCVLTPKGWRRMADLKSGDIVVGRFQESHGKGRMPLGWTDVLRANANAVKTPKHMTPAFAQFLGMLVADGHTLESTGHVGITCKNDHVAATFRKICQEVFGIMPKETVDKRNSVLSLYLTSRNLVRFVESLVSRGVYNKHAPLAVLQGSYDEKLAFLTGTTLDGYVTLQGLVVYEGMSKDLAYHIAEIARSFGMPRVNQGYRWVAVSKAYTHSVAVSNEIQEIIIPIEPHKRKTATYKRFKVLADVPNIARSKFDSRSTEYYALRSAQNRNQNHVLNTTAKALGVPAGTPVHRVTKVEDAGVVEMYDVEVEDAHEYVVNGMVSHNTVNVPNSATIQDIQEVYQEMWAVGCKGGTVYRDASRDEQVLYPDQAQPELDEVEVEIVEESEETQIVRPRPDVGHSITFSESSPTGTVHATLRHDPESGIPLEIFINSGKGEIAAVAEALGRLSSMILRWPDNAQVNQQTRLELIRDQLINILGPGQDGMGPGAKRSLPDTIAKIINQYLAAEFPGAHLPFGLTQMRTLLKEARKLAQDPEAFERFERYTLGEDQQDQPEPDPNYRETMETEIRQTEAGGIKLSYDLCPDCGNGTLVSIPGKCPYCRTCGYTRC